jgi:cation transporter-like permease
MDRITLIRRSLTTFVCGIFALIPVLGIVAGVYAWVCGWGVRRHARGEWNPAAAYLRWGLIMAGLGMTVTLLLVAVALTILAYRFG